MCAYARHNANVFSKGPIYDGEEVEDTKKICAYAPHNTKNFLYVQHFMKI